MGWTTLLLFYLVVMRDIFDSWLAWLDGDVGAAMLFIFSFSPGRYGTDSVLM